MNEGVIFVVELVLLGAAGLAAAGASSASGRLAAGLHAAVTGAGLLLIPLLGWEAAHTDNAFLGLYLIAILAVLLGVALSVVAVLRLRGSPARPRAAAAAIGAVAAILALAWLTLRGPGAWVTGSGQFGLDVILVALGLGVIAYLAGQRIAGNTRPPVAP
jgi:hypothetical protein